MARVLTLPLTMTGNGSLATVAQDHPAEIAQSVALLLATRPGERRTVPGYGLPDPVFDGVDPAVVADVVAEWEPRANPDSIETATDGAEQNTVVHLIEEA